MAASISSDSIDEDFPTSTTDVTVESSNAISGTFTNVSLENLENAPQQKKKKQPRRILHFSDGIMEEYSTDEEINDVDEYNFKPPPVDPKTLNWFPYLWYYVTVSAVTALNYADFCGEKLAWFFGITSPKYQTAIDEYERIKAEEEEERRERELETISAQDRTEAGIPDVSIKNMNTAESLIDQHLVPIQKY